jgi:oligopeptide transport system ATP-binding protein
MSLREPIVKVENLVKYFPVKGRLSESILRREANYVHAVDDVSFSVYPGETIAVVGESGSGKTTLGLLILRLLEPTSGKIYFDGDDISKTHEKSLKRVRRGMQVVFQDPSSSLDPHLKIFDTVAEPLIVAGNGTNKKENRRELVSGALKAVGLSESQMSHFPHQFSGGQRQRIALARAIILNPKFIVLDEPTSSLDASVQSQIMMLLLKLQKEYNLSYMLITHNISVANYLADKIAVMYLGQIVEMGSTKSVIDHPMHPYTQILISSVLTPDKDSKLRQTNIKGEIPSPINPPSGCRFHTRCPYAKARCSAEEPELRQVEPGHTAKCHYAEEILTAKISA